MLFLPLGGRVRCFFLYLHLLSAPNPLHWFFRVKFGLFRFFTLAYSKGFVSSFLLLSLLRLVFFYGFHGHFLVVPTTTTRRTLPREFLLFVGYVYLLGTTPHLFGRGRAYVHHSRIVPSVSPRGLANFFHVYFIWRVFVPMGDYRVFFLLRRLIYPSLIAFGVQLLFRLPSHGGSLLRFFRNAMYHVLRCNGGGVKRFSFHTSVLPRFLYRFSAVRLFFRPYAWALTRRKVVWGVRVSKGVVTRFFRKVCICPNFLCVVKRDHGYFVAGWWFARAFVPSL